MCTASQDPGRRDVRVDEEGGDSRTGRMDVISVALDLQEFNKERSVERGEGVGVGVGVLQVAGIDERKENDGETQKRGVGDM